MRLKAIKIGMLGLLLGLSACQTSTSGYGRVGAKTGSVAPAHLNVTQPRMIAALRHTGVARAVALPKGQNLYV